VKTDAWRGHAETKLNGSFTNVGSGWQTGMPDHTVQYKVVGAELYEAMKEEAEQLTLPFVAIWIFAPTSNVFSMATDFYVRTDDIQAFRDWLELRNVSEETFVHSFS
jgi:hypothetical protein